jgi:hypothetical protein
VKAGARIRQEVKGCLRKDGTCRAPVPQDVVMKTEVDSSEGSIRMEKHEAMINTVTPVVTCTFVFNTDVTSLLSGNSIETVVAYISDYITKVSLKIYHMVDIVKDVLSKNTAFGFLFCNLTSPEKSLLSSLALRTGG